MKNNLEKLVKGCFKRKFSMSLAALTMFAITGNVAYSAYSNDIWLYPGISIFTDDIYTGEDVHVGENLFVLGSQKTFGDSHVLGDSIVKGDSYVDGLQYVYKDHIVYGTSYLRGNVTAANHLTVKKNLKVNGDSIVKGDSIVRGGLYAEDDSYINGDLSVRGRTYVHGSSYVKGDSTVEENLTVKGDSTVEGKLLVGGLNVKENIEKNTKEIATESKRRALADTQLAYEIGTNRGNINKLEKEVEARREADERQDKAIVANSSAIKHLDRKVNKGTAMTVAMSNVDFQNINTGEVAIGAGIGHYVGDQAVAVGIAYGVNEDLKVHAKWSGVAGDPHYNAIGGGVTYKFKTR